MTKEIITVDGHPIKTEDVITFMKITGAYQHAQRTVIMNEVIKDYAKHNDINVNVDALQVFSDLRRMNLGLHNVQEMQTFLKNLGVTLEDWEESLENELYRYHVKSTDGSNIFLMDAWSLIRGIPEVRNHISAAISDLANEKGIKVEDSILQENSDALRRLMDMHNASEFQVVLNALRMSEDDWGNYVHSNSIIHHLSNNEVTNLFDQEIKVALQKYPIVNTLVSDIVFGQIIHAKAKKNDITIEDSELQEHSDNIRRSLKLHSTKSFNIWLDASGLTLEDFEHIVETELIKKKMADKGIGLFDNQKIERAVKVSPFFTQALNDVKVATAVYAKSKESNLLPSLNDIDDESNTFRRAFGLHKADDFNNYLNSIGISLENWESFCEYSTMMKKVKKAETTKEKVVNLMEKNTEFDKFVKDSAFKGYLNEVVGKAKISFS